MTMKIQYFLLALIGSLLPYILNASIIENIHFTHIGLVDGLSHSTIFAINQDKGGNLWFATYDGVNKYDGYNFTVYRHQYMNPNSIASDISRCIAVDDSDRIWVGTREGLSLYNRYKDAFSNYYYKKRGMNVAVTSIAPIKEDWLMLGTAEGVLLFDAKRGCFLNDTLPATLHMLRPTVLVRQGDLIYIGAENGVYTYTLSNGILDKLVDMPNYVRVHAILCQMFNQVWMATEGDGLYMYDTKSSWKNGIHNCIESYLRSQICIVSHILGESDKYNDSYFYTSICGKGGNSSESEGSSIKTTITNENLTKREDSKDLDETQKYKHLWIECENCYGLNYRKFFKSKMNICEHCGYHLKMSSSDRIELSIDPSTWRNVSFFSKSITLLMIK